MCIAPCSDRRLATLVALLVSYPLQGATRTTSPDDVVGTEEVLWLVLVQCWLNEESEAQGNDCTRRVCCLFQGTWLRAQRVDLSCAQRQFLSSSPDD